MITPVPFDDLESAFEWVSASAPCDNAAYISKTTGQVFYASQTHDVDDELPEDYEDADLYWTVPHKHRLDLGKDLVFRFVDEQLPDQFDAVRAIFYRRGAYGRFKDLLDRQGLLDAWHAYEQAATEAALLAWAQEEGMPVTAPRPRAGGDSAARSP